MRSGGVRMAAAVMVGALLLANCAADTPEEPDVDTLEGEEDRSDVELDDVYESPVGVGRASPPEGEFVDVSVSSRTSCGVRVDGSLVCWGDFFGEPPGGEFTAVSVGEEVACALRADGSPVCWGAEWRDGLVESGLLEPPAGEFVDVSIYPRSLTGCGVRIDGSLVCWGGGHYGQLDVPGGEFTEVVTGPRLCALSVAGGLACWGDPYNKGLLYAPLGVFQSVSSRSGYACAVRDSGELVCWGANPPVGDGPPGGEFTEVSVAGAGMCALTVGGDAACWGTGRPELDTVRAGPFTQISASSGVVCALRTSGETKCWGNRTWYDGTAYVSKFGDWRPPAGRFAQVAAHGRGRGDSYMYACGIRADTTIACWNHGDPATAFELEPPPPQESAQTASLAFGAGFTASGAWWGPGIVQLDWDDVAGASGYELMWYSEHGWVLLSESEPVSGAIMDLDGSAADVGNLPEHRGGNWFTVRARNEQGASEWSASFSVAVPLSMVPGLGYRSNHLSRWLVDDLPAEAGFVSVAVAEDDACALRIDSTVVCWGHTSDTYDTPSRIRPDSILSPTGEFTQIATVFPKDYGYFCGLRVDTSVVCWSSNHRTMYWYFPTGWPSPPVQPETSAVGMARLGFGFCSIDTKGQVTCWEHAYFDEPPQWAKQLAGAAVGPTSACGIHRTDSTLACWDTATGEPADTPEGPFSDIDASVGGGFCAVTADGALACWNTDKLLEDPPVGEFTELAVGAEHACAIRSDNTLACWGSDGE